MPTHTRSLRNCFRGFRGALGILLALGLVSHCFSHGPAWIRMLPSKASSLQNQDISGKYAKRGLPKSTLHSPRFQNSWKEEIVLFPGGTFQKDFFQTNSTPQSEEEESSTGKGFWNQAGPWVLLETFEISRKKCTKDTGQKQHCKESTEISKEIGKPLRSLLYHYQDQSLVSLQFETNYKESAFGIAYEVAEPYKEDANFFRVRKKYSQKEFQPHAYFSVKLD